MSGSHQNDLGRIDTQDSRGVCALMHCVLDLLVRSGTTVSAQRYELTDAQSERWRDFCLARQVVRAEPALTIVSL